MPTYIAMMLGSPVRAAALAMLIGLSGCGDDEKEPVDPCAGVTCSGHGTCAANDAGAAVCTCAAGFAVEGLTCNDVDECAGGSDDCAADATCTDTDGSFTCACNAGFTGNGKTCVADVPVDPCDGNDCHADATCIPGESDYTCECDEGFVGDGTDCVPADPCTDNMCPENSTCVPGEGQYTCECDDGFVADGETCVPADPCIDNACPESSTCVPGEGQYTCECDDGFVADGETCVPAAAECDPEAETNDCAYACLPLDAGGGVCVDVCATDDDCVADMRCDAEYAPEGETGLCLPNASCGTLTYFGECDGATLRFCGFEGPIEIDCSEGTDGLGAPLTCQFLSDDIGNDCMSSSFTGGCGEVPAEGTCSGTNLTWCQSQASGVVAKFDCASEGLVCLEADGVADCVEEGASGCGTVSERGSCEGTTATWCESYAVTSVDCSATNEVCGVASGNFRCVPPLVAGGASSVGGRFVFEKKALAADGLGAVSNKPVRFALVTVRKVADDTRLAQTYTDTDGAFTLQFEGSEEVYVLLTAQGEPGKHNHAIYDCPMEDCGGDNTGNLYGVTSDSFMPAAATDLGELTITVDSNIAGAFNIFDLFVAGADFASANMGRVPPPVIVQWRSGSGTAGGTSYFQSSRGSIFILGGPDDTDEYDDPVLLHEYGHFLEFYLSHSDSPGGSHDGSPTDPRLAWGEGLGTYVGCAIADTPLYIDTTAAGASATDIRVAGNQYLAKPNDPRGMKQLVSEYLIAQILWTIAMGPTGSNGQTHAPAFDVFANHFTALTPALDRGVEGVELVDFLDGWFCKQHGVRPYIEGIVTDTAKFPYDYAGPATCN